MILAEAEGTAEGMIPTTGRPVIGGVVGTVIGTCHHRTRVGVAMEGEAAETSMIDEGELNIKPLIFVRSTCTYCRVCVCVCIRWYEFNCFPRLGLTIGTMTEVGVVVLLVVREALVTGGRTETGR